MNYSEIATALGGLGLLLLGMSLLTDGLKAAAGNHLRGFLERSTQTRAKAAASGFLMTALVQSSGAVVVALLGFTNAGMLRLKQAAWVVFGSNVGTTVTAWIVALVGLQFKVTALALPMIGVGMLLRLTNGDRKWSNIGLAMAGFGVLFVGLDLLQSGFADAVAWLPLDQFQAQSFAAIGYALLSGFLLTALLQSSSASLAIILSAAVSGIFSPYVGAALVIGANLGSTMMAVLASIGATPNAKRLAAIHVMMNVVTALVALALLQPLWWFTTWLVSDPSSVNLATDLAVFHSLFNILGLALMRVGDQRLLTLIERWISLPPFRSGKARYLDSTVLEVPAMGVAALVNEQQRVFRQHILRLRTLLHDEIDAESRRDQVATGELLQVITDFSEKLSQTKLQGEQAEDFVELSRSRHFLFDLRRVLEQLEQSQHARLQQSLSDPLKQLLIKALHDIDAPLGAELEAVVMQIQQQRHADHQALLVRINRGEIPAIEGTEALQLLTLWGQVVELMLGIQKVLFPTLPQADK